MKISYNWLKQYLDIPVDAQALKEVLTSIGLEVEGMETYESVTGGLRGLYVGHVLEAGPHPQADKLTVTRVDLGSDAPANIVCGAPNVAKGQKVAVAPVGSTLYGGKEPLKMKKMKLRGVPSEGMICAEDELGLGDGHEGILVLDETARPGQPLSEVIPVETDTVFEIDLTPNRADSTSHWGIARDLYAYFQHHGYELSLTKPVVEPFAPDNTDNPVAVEIADTEGCKRYSGITVSGIKVGPSPEWLQQRLKAIGLAPINNVVDVTNYVLHETGHPLHAFDVDKIDGNKIIIRTLPEKTPFKALDEETYELSADDLMICNENQGMCIAGVFGGVDSGVQDGTTAVFIESAYFDPVYVRKTSKRHLLHTDAAYRFERGADPNITLYAMKRAALLIKDVAGGQISSDIVDAYPEPFGRREVRLRYSHVRRLLGITIPQEAIKSILKDLEFEVLEEEAESLLLDVPLYRVDVTREADVIEEILRIYGYDNIAYSDQVKSSIAYTQKPDDFRLSELISGQLAGAGFAEAMTMSMHPKAFYKDKEGFDTHTLVELANPLSRELNVMRQTLVHDHLDAIARSKSHSQPDVRMFELGRIYFRHENPKAKRPIDQYHEEQVLALSMSGLAQPATWKTEARESDFFLLKSHAENVLKRLNFQPAQLKLEEKQDGVWAYSLGYFIKKQEVVRIGAVQRPVLEAFGIGNDVFYAEIYWTRLLRHYTDVVSYQPMPRFPTVRRDLALLLDKSVSFGELRNLAFDTERKLLKEVSIFDVYEGKQVPEGKKSYALSFALRDETKTLKDKQIDKVMNKLAQTFKQKAGAELR